MLAAGLADIDEALLQRAVAENWPEGSTLAFKLDPPTDKHELTKDVTALANDVGGDLMFGIATVDDCA